MLDASQFEEALISLAYRLLYLHPIGCEATGSITETAYHLGAVAVLWTVLFESGRLHRSPYTLLAERLEDAVDALLAAGTEENELLLWLLFISGISVLRPTDTGWLHGRIKCCIAVLGLGDWQCVREVLKMFPWINLIHDQPGERLFLAAAKWDENVGYVNL